MLRLIVHKYMVNMPVLRVTTDCGLKDRSRQPRFGSTLDSWTNKSLWGQTNKQSSIWQHYQIWHHWQSARLELNPGPLKLVERNSQREPNTDAVPAKTVTRLTRPKPLCKKNALFRNDDQKNKNRHYLLFCLVYYGSIEL